MKQTAEQFINEVKELENDLVKMICSQVNVDAIESIDVDEIRMVQKSLKLMNTSCDLLLKQAEMMDNMNEKLNTMLKKIEEKA